jgi:hypothetical protein
MRSNLSGDTLGGKGPLLASRVSGVGSGRSKVDQRTLGGSQARVKDRIVFGETGSPAALVVEVSLTIPRGSVEDGTGEDGRRGSLSGSWRLSVWIAKAGR